MKQMLPLFMLLTLAMPASAQDNPLLLRPEQLTPRTLSPLEQERTRIYNDQLLPTRRELEHQQATGTIDPLAQRDLQALRLEQERINQVLTRPTTPEPTTPTEAEIRQNLRPNPPLAGTEYGPAPLSSGRPGKQPRGTPQKDKKPAQNQDGEAGRQ
jgi:hypothetical protein